MKWENFASNELYSLFLNGVDQTVLNFTAPANASNEIGDYYCTIRLSKKLCYFGCRMKFESLSKYLIAFLRCIPENKTIQLISRFRVMNHTQTINFRDQKFKSENAAA